MRLTLLPIVVLSTLTALGSFVLAQTEGTSTPPYIKPADLDLTLKWREAYLSGGDLKLEGESCGGNFVVSTSTGDVIKDHLGGYWTNMIYFGRYGEQWLATGLYFPTVTIPQGSTITTANIIFTHNSNYAGSSTFAKIYGYDADNGTTFADEADFDSKYSATTTAEINWDNIPTWTTNATSATPDISNVIQEIVSRAGWTENNGIDLFVSDIEKRSATDPENSRIAMAYGDNPSLTPILHIECIASTSSTSTVSNASGTSEITNPEQYPYIIFMAITLFLGTFAIVLRT